MKNKICLLYWLLAFLSPVLRRQSNNDYRFVNTIGGTFRRLLSRAALGDTVRYKPVLHFASGNGDELDLAYEWTFAGKTIGDELNLEWIVDTVATGQVILRVTDRANGLVYSNQKSLRIDSPYKSKGWMILSEKNGQSSLGFVREMITAYEMDDLGIYCVFDNQTFPDVYEETNGEVLGSGPVRISRAFSRTAPGSLLILQGSSGLYRYRREYFIARYLSVGDFMDRYSRNSSNR
ncbi:MAG: PKD-like family lipoprotein [Odoribacter splanchnicus]